MRFAILTGGGDVPGLNACIKAFVNRVYDSGHEVVGIRRGWAGLLLFDPDGPAPDLAMRLDPTIVRTIDRTGGTVLHTSRTNPASVRPSEVPPFLADRATGEGPHDFTSHVIPRLALMVAVVYFAADDRFSLDAWLRSRRAT